MSASATKVARELSKWPSPLLRAKLDTMARNRAMLPHRRRQLLACRLQELAKRAESFAGQFVIDAADDNAVAMPRILDIDGEVISE